MVRTHRIESQLRCLFDMPPVDRDMMDMVRGNASRYEVKFLGFVDDIVSL
jgi:hypothetical protein